MKDIHAACVDIAREYGDVGNYVLGANIAGFIMVANSVIDQGIVSFPGRRSGLRAAGTAQASPPLLCPTAR